MIYRQISSKIVIGSIFDRFNIDYGGFVSRVPNWIHRAMSSMNLNMELLDDTVDSAVVDYKATIPDECKLLVGVTYLDKRLPRLGYQNQTLATNMPTLIHDQFSYELNKNGYIITTFETAELGELKFYIKKLPSELDATTNIYFPLIPDDNKLIDALEWYILKRLLERGHKVGEFSLAKNNTFLNPAMAWEIARKKAINSIEAMDADERQQVSKIKRDFIQDYDYYDRHSINTKVINPN